MKSSPWIDTKTQERPQIKSWILPEPNAGRYISSVGLVSLSERFSPISLKEMDSVALLNRIDTKFVMTGAQLLKTLNSLTHNYRILSVKGRRLNHYRTLYFDFPNFDLYNLHINDRANRYKVRSREYIDSSQSFIEVKHKTPKDRTIKSRILTDQPVTEMSLEAENWLQGVFPYDCRSLEPKLWNTFTRITLVNLQHGERVTLDVDLSFYTASKVAHLDGIAIAEVKIDANNHTSPFLAQMHAQKIRPQGFSKYCIGVSLLYDQVKKNAMKARMLKIEKMVAGVYYE